MAFEIPKQPYSGVIGETVIGTGDGAVKIGGEDSYPFHIFEGKMPNVPQVAMEIWDYDPSSEWPAPAVEALKDVLSSPEAWAKKCVDEYGADIIVLQLKSIDPNGMNRSADEAAGIAKKLVDAVNVPLVFWGTASNQKDEEVLKKISEVCEGKNVSLSPIEEGNHKGVGASALGYGHTIVSSSPIDVNLAKQLNILLGNLGVKKEKLVIDPTTGGLGYGMEYSYSVMERIRMAALTQEDDKLQIPMINNVGNEIWKCKEAGQSVEDAPTLGDPEKRPVLMEVTAAVCYLLAGSDIVILRHPESVRIVRSFINLMTNGGTAKDITGISKLMAAPDVDLVSLSPEMNLTIEGEMEVKKEKPAKKEAKPQKPKAEAKPEPKKEKAAPAPKKEEKKAEDKAKAEADARAKAEKEAETKAKAAEEAKKKETEDRAKAEADARAKAEAEAKAKAEAEAKAKAEAAKAKEEAKNKEKEELQALRLKRAQEREKHEAEMKTSASGARTKTPSKDQIDLVERLTKNLDRIHKRI